MQHQTNNSSVLMVLGVIVSIAAFLVSYFLIIPSYKDNRSKLAQTSADLSAASDKLSSLEATQTSIDQMGGLLSQVLVAIPGDKDSSNTISELEAIAAVNKTYIPSIQVTDVSSTNSTTGTAVSANSVSVAFSVNGSFDNLNAFVAGVEKSPKIFTVKSLSLSSGDAGVMTLAVQLESYKRLSTTAPASTVSSN